ncbi:hypothetical protein VNO78_13381 [Psophocarpus tetragonolobus]|uniref:Uncharacterized protein n=1 Tax=Psophocarpus tetragonolobus TaxID=3891 RepID=A0AAN9SQ22_PSOTE
MENVKINDGEKEVEGGKQGLTSKQVVHCFVGSPLEIGGMTLRSTRRTPSLEDSDCNADDNTPTDTNDNAINICLLWVNLNFSNRIIASMSLFIPKDFISACRALMLVLCLVAPFGLKVALLPEVFAKVEGFVELDGESVKGADDDILVRSSRDF